MTDQHIEQPRELSSRRLYRQGNCRSGKQLQAIVVPGHKAFEQGTVETMQVPDCIRGGEQRLQVQVKSSVSKRRSINQRGVAVCGLQGEGKIHGDGRGPAPTLRIDHGEYTATSAFPLDLALGGTQTHKRFQKVGGGSGALD